MKDSLIESQEDSQISEAEKVESTENDVDHTEIEARTRDEKEYEQKTVFDVPKLRKKLESELKPFNVEELLLDGKLTQVIPIGSKLNITLTTLDTGTDMIIERLIYEIAEDRNLSIAKLTMPLHLAASLKHYKGSPLIKNPVEYDPSKRNEKEYLSYLTAVFDKISSFNRQFVVLLTTHLFWFDERVSEFMKSEFLGEAENF
jgi:hypothetical protein